MSESSKLLIHRVLKFSGLKQLPTTLYHYTNFPPALRGFLKSGVLRATHVSYTNDRIEFLHAVDVTRSIARERLQSATALPEKNLLMAMEDNLTATNPFNTQPVAISCFCEDGDLLSQWRGYGLGEGGIAIGFDARKILPTLKAWNGYIAPVVYTDVDQRRILGEVIAACVLEYDRILKSRSIADPAMRLSTF